MLVDFNTNYITVFATNFFYPLQCFYLLKYKIWYSLQDQIRDVHELRERIVDERDKLDQRIIDKVVQEWRKRLHACVVAVCRCENDAAYS